MTTLAVYLVVLVVVGALLFGLACLVFGRGEELAPLPAGATPTVLPEVDVSGADVRELRFQQVVRGYKASEVDWALEHLAAELDRLHGLVTEKGAHLISPLPPRQIPAPPPDPEDTP